MATPTALPTGLDLLLGPRRDRACLLRRAGLRPSAEITDGEVRLRAALPAATAGGTLVGWPLTAAESACPDRRP